MPHSNFQKRIVSAETICGNTVYCFPLIDFSFSYFISCQLQWLEKFDCHMLAREAMKYLSPIIDLSKIHFGFKKKDLPIPKYPKKKIMPNLALQSLKCKCIKSEVANDVVHRIYSICNHVLKLNCVQIFNQQKIYCPNIQIFRRKGRNSCQIQLCNHWNATEIKPEIHDFGKENYSHERGIEC